MTDRGTDGQTKGKTIYLLNPLGGVALTRYLLPINCNSMRAKTGRGTHGQTKGKTRCLSNPSGVCVGVFGCGGGGGGAWRGLNCKRSCAHKVATYYTTVTVLELKKNLS